MQTIRAFRTPAMASLLAVAAMGSAAGAAGTWQTISLAAPSASGGGLMLLSDGSVLCKSQNGGTDGYGNIWNRLTPNAAGSYASGTWSSIAPMIDTRLYFSSQILRDGRLYVAGGEYGTGLAKAEVYDPLTNAWTATPSPGANISDANSEMLADGRVLQARVAGTLKTTVIYNPVTNTFATGPSTVGIHNESAWVKLRDASILMVDRNSTASERYRPSSNSWVADATVPVSLYDPYGLETGGAVLLPDGRAFFTGSTGKTALYTSNPTGGVGSWAAGADIPGGQGTPDAPMAMMFNGKVLCAVSPAPTSATHFPTPTAFYEYDPATNTFTQVGAPGGGTTVNTQVFVWNFINLPDGKIMATRQGVSTYWVYTPDGAPLPEWRPSVRWAARAPNGTFTITGTQLNGISEGSSYGDDWQMNTNYPVVRFTRMTGTNVWYARTLNWSSTGVQTGSTVVSTQMTLPAGLPLGTLNLTVTANGIASDPYVFWNPNPSCVADLNLDGQVNGADMAVVLAGWGTPAASTGGGDLTGDGMIGGDDLGVVLAAWGPCPG
jgi:hypothetical protein